MRLDSHSSTSSSSLLSPNSTSTTTPSLPIFTVTSAPPTSRPYTHTHSRSNSNSNPYGRSRSKSPQRARSQSQQQTRTQGQTIVRFALRADGCLELTSSGNQDVAVLKHVKVGGGGGKGRWTHVALVWYPHRGSNPNIREYLSFFHLFYTSKMVYLLYLCVWGAVI